MTSPFLHLVAYKYLNLLRAYIINIHEMYQSTCHNYKWKGHIRSRNEHYLKVLEF
jgi:hypothetical protein